MVEPEEEAEEIAEREAEVVAAVDLEAPAVGAPQTEQQATDAGFDPEEDGELEFELDLSKSKQQRRQDRQKRRQLVLDEQSGEVIAKRRRKGGRGSWDEESWEDYEF